MEALSRVFGYFDDCGLRMMVFYCVVNIGEQLKWISQLGIRT